MDQLQTNKWRVKSLLFIALLGLTACGGSSSSEEEVIVSPAPSDISPDAFSFLNIKEHPIATRISSKVITVTGINAASPISISGGEYAIDGGEFSSVASTVNNQQTVSVRLLTSTQYSTSTELTLTIGDISGTFSVTTHEPPADTSPDTFSFLNTTEQAIASNVSSNAITVTGINTASPISISGGEYSIDGGEFSSVANTVNNQQTVSVRLLTSTQYSTSTELTLTIGDINGTFSVTTHGPMTKFANELNDDISAKYSIVNQPYRGKISVSSDLTQLTYHPMNGFDYLQVGETAQETVSVELLGEENKSYELNFTITGQSNSSVCDERTAIDLMPSEVNQPLTNIPENNCVHLDASNLSGGNRWVLWTGESGGARDIIFSVIGVEPSNANLTFLPPVRGRYSLSWCPSSGECAASFYFNSETVATEKELDVQLNVHNFHPEDEIYLSVNEKNNEDTTGYTYRWIIYDWANEYHKLVDIVTTENKLKLPISPANNNYNITVIVDDNNVQLTGGFTTSSSDLYGKIRLNVETIGNYKKLNEYEAIRDENSTQKAPQLVVMIDGDSTRYQGNEDEYLPIEAAKGSQLTFDMSEATDENGDALSFYINGVLHESSSNRFTFDVTSDAYYIICASDGFPWTSEENPCVLFDLISQ